jgi:hypothetical protein
MRPEGHIRDLPLPPGRLAGGLSTEGDTLAFRMGNRVVGPAPGIPLLLVYGDLGPPPPSGTSAVRLSLANLKAQIMRATCPVLDLLWQGERVRLAATGMAWKGLPNASLSSPLNLVVLLHLLADRAGGALIDLTFSGIAPGLEGGAGSAWDPPSGADRERTAAFERHVAIVAGAWAQGSLPRPAPGLLAEIGSVGPSVKGPEAPVAPPWAQAPSDRPKAPWIQKEGQHKRLTLKVWPVLWGGPLIAIGLGRLALTLGPWVLGAAGAVAIALGLRDLAFLQELQAVPEGKVRSLAMGPVEVSGRICSSAPVLARCAPVRCAWYRWEEQQKVTEYITDGQGHNMRTTSWKTVASATFGEIPFQLDDGTGKVWVQPAGAEVEVESSTTQLAFDRRLIEWLLPDGGQVFALGVAQHRTDRPTFQQRMHDRLAALKQDPVALARYGVAAGGPPAQDVWDAVRAAVEKEVVAEVGTEQAEPDDVFIGAGKGAPFLLVDRSRTEELKRLKYRALGGTIVGGLYALISAGWLIAHALH